MPSLRADTAARLHVLGAGAILPRKGYGCSGYALETAPQSMLTLLDCGPVRRSHGPVPVLCPASDARFTPCESAASCGGDSADASAAKAWKDIWGCGQGIGAIKEVVSTADMVARFKREYAEAKARIL